jgi:uncharacterized protein (TIGR02466 family)
MSDSEFHAVFPALTVMRKTLGREFTQAEHEFLYKQHEVKINLSNATTLRKDLLEEPCLADLKQFFVDAMKEYIEKIVEPVEKDIEPYITQSWLVYTEKGEFHHRHKHPNSYLSGVFYVETLPEDETEFVNPYFDNKAIYLHSEHTNWNNAMFWKFPATKYTLLLFPSDISHGVPKKQTDGLRISLPFNSFLKGTLGNKWNISELILD